MMISSALRRCFPTLCLLLTITGVWAQHQHAPPAPPDPNGGKAAAFSENKGQWDDYILYRLRFNNGNLFLEKNAFTFAFVDAHQLDEVLAHPHEHGQEVQDKLMRGEEIKFDAHAFRIRFKGANPQPATQGTAAFGHYENYYLGNDPNKWASGVGVYNGVDYAELYPGIDMKIKGHGQALKYDFIVAPNTDPKQIVLQFEGVDNLYLKDGQLHYETSVTHIYETAPYAYQTIDGQNRKVACRFVLKDNEVSFDFPDGYNTNYPLVIDPTLIFASYTGSTTDNWGYTATYDQAGNLYAGGTIFRGLGYPTTVGAYQPFFAGGANGPPNSSGLFHPCDIGISKFNADGTNLLFSTYLGGSGNEAPHSLVVNSQNELLVYGATGSSNFPMQNPVQGIFRGGLFYINTNVIEFTNGTDIYISKFNAAGTTLTASTYAGGSGNDGLNTDSTLVFNYADQARGEIIVDDNDFIYVTSSTWSNDLPLTPNAAQNTLGGRQDACLLKYTPNLQSLLISTYIGGTEGDAGYSLKVDSNSDIFICGGTRSNNMPSMTGVNPAYSGGVSDGYVIKVNAAGTAFNTGTYIGTNQYDQAYIIEVDPLDEVYLYGQTKGIYPITAGVYSNPNSRQFIHKLNNDLDSTRFSTVFGSGSFNVNISPTALLVDVCDNIYISGWGGNVNNEGNTLNMPITPDAHQPTTDGSDFYFMVLSKDADSLVYGTYFGGNGTNGEHVDGGTSRFDQNGIIYQAVCAACGGTNIFPTTPGVWAEVSGQFGVGNCNLGVIKFEFEQIDVQVDIGLTPQPFGCVPYTVTFNAISTADNDYLWDFGNGVTSTASDTTITYTAIGTYNIRIIAVNSTSCSGLVLRDTAFATITVGDEPLDAGFTYNVLSDCETYEVQFTNTSTTAAPGTMIYNWDFGDGTTSNLPNPLHQYQTSGTYTVNMVVQNINACNRLDTFSTVITFLPTQTLQYSIDDTIGCPPFDINITNNSFSQAGQVVGWDFGDGTQITTTSPGPIQHTYATAGNYLLTVTAISPGSCNPLLTDTVPITVVPPSNVSAGFEVVVLDSCDTYLISITDTSTNATSITYTLGDGNTIITPNGAHTYASSGTYTITQIASNPLTCNEHDTASYSLTFLPKQEFAISVSDTAGCDPLTVIFTNLSTNVTTQAVIWDFGDGTRDTTVNLATATHTYPTPGNYTVVATALAPFSCNPNDTVELDITVFPPDTVLAGFELDILDTCDQYLISLTDTSFNGFQITYYFGNGDSSTSLNPVYEYNNAGTYTIMQVATNNTRCPNSDTAFAQVTFLPSQRLRVSIADTSGCRPFTAGFVNQSTGAQTIIWQYGDGTNDTTGGLTNPTHIYTDPGTYSVTVTATNPSVCNPILRDTLTVEVFPLDSVFAGFVLDITDSCAYTIAIVDTSSNASFIKYLFGNGDSSVVPSPVYQYALPGNYTITQIVSSTGNCPQTDTARFSINLYPRVVAAYAVPDTGCVPFTTNFADASTVSNQATYAWSFGDAGTSAQPSPTHTYTSTGSFTVSLVVVDPLSCNGTDTATSTVTAIDDSIFVDFRYNIVSRSCDSLVVQFIDESINAATYFWDFGDGTTSTLPSPRHTYTVADTFEVTFTAAHPWVCNQPDTLEETFILEPRVTAVFDPTNGCIPYLYEVANLGEHVATTYWQLSNGETSTDFNPTFYFDSIGSFTLNLTNYNPETCNDSAKFRGVFNVYTPPTAYFETDTSAYQLYQNVLFDNQSTFPAFYSWEFGDGDSSAQRNPYHEYREVGFFEPCLTVLDENLCTATYCKDLEIYFIGIVDVPNAFSPNGDGSNDVLYVRGYGVTEMEFKVFNRWGELVFESNSLDVGWDGTYKSKGQEMEVYIYTLQARFLDGTETGIRKGNVTLLR